MSKGQAFEEDVSRPKMQCEPGKCNAETTYESGNELEPHPPYLLSVLTYLALGQLRLDRRPCLALSSITQQIHDNCPL